MSQHIVQINTFEIKPGKLDDFKASVLDGQAFAEANDPLLMGDMYIDEEKRLARAFLIHRDAESILAHWNVSAKHMTKVMDFCTAKRVEILGDPGDAVMERLRQYEEAGVELRMTPHFAGFSHLVPAHRPGAAASPMRWSRGIRRTHRWLAIAFTALVVLNIVLNFVPVPEQVATGVGILTLLPLFLLLFSGLYLFVLPYAARRRARRGSAR